MSHGFIVAIDGTAGSGKSTTARLAAQELGFLHLDTGAMYRAITLKVIRQKLDLNNTALLEKLLESTQLDLRPEPSESTAKDAKNAKWSSVGSAGRGARVILDGEDVSEAIRTPEVDKSVSQVSVIPQVRQLLVAEQRRIAEGRRVVCEGRDITSVVFPHADLKFYVDASLAARAERRKLELTHKGMAVSVKSIEDNLTERDYIDSTRAHSPLTRVKDAIYLDTSNLTVDEEVMIVVNLTRMRIGRDEGRGARGGA